MIRGGNKPQTLEGYQNYHRVKGKSLKSGCRFYVKEGRNFKPRKDLEIRWRNGLVVKVLDCQSRGPVFMVGSMVDPEVDKMSTRNFWELSGKK